MKTLSNTIALAVQSALVAAMPTSKTVASENMLETLNNVILPLLPVIDVASPEVLASWSKACSNKGVMIDSFNPFLAYVPGSQLFSRTEANNGDFKEAFTYALQNVTVNLDTVLRLATLLMLKHKRARPAIVQNSGSEQVLHFAAEALEALELINNDAILADDGEASTSTRPVFNFAEHGLDASMFATGNKSVYTMPNNGGYKVYLKEEFELEFFNLKKAGLLLPKMFSYQEEGDFKGCYAVLIPVKA